MLRQIEEFDETYTSDKAIYWYTRDTFLFRLVNKTLRTQNNFNIIFTLRYYLTDLISELRTAQLDLDETIPYSLTSYRDKRMTI